MSNFQIRLPLTKTSIALKTKVAQREYMQTKQTYKIGMFIIQFTNEAKAQIG